MAEIEPVLYAALDAAGAVLMRHYGAVDRVDEKGALDLVTQADRESEAAIKALLRGHFPDHAIVAEESGAEGEGRVRWVVDPLDGTTNFAHSFPVFAVSIAVECDGRTVAAGVENPFSRERFLAFEGRGATLNGRRIRPSTEGALARALVASGFPYDRRERIDHYLAYWKAFLCRCHGVVRLGSAALDLCSVACGRLDAFWEEGLKPWDTAAGALIVAEAGGRVSGYGGGPYRPGDPSVLASNGLVHDACVALLAEVAAGEGRLTPRAGARAPPERAPRSRAAAAACAGRRRRRRAACVPRTRPRRGRRRARCGSRSARSPAPARPPRCRPRARRRSAPRAGSAASRRPRAGAAPPPPRRRTRRPAP
ncbi:MAG TPA: inositol monophosphatase family protein [Polyangiaceae bacterium]|nr:inositol monophosphatase family protein [Polyangiaceae bacterium]